MHVYSHQYCFPTFVCRDISTITTFSNLYLINILINEDRALNKCRSIVSLLEKIRKYIEDAITNVKDLSCSLDILHCGYLMKIVWHHSYLFCFFIFYKVVNLRHHWFLLEQETTLKQCIVQFESVDVVRICLMNLLEEALIEHVLS